jgi:predicted ferric reductase
VFPRGASSTERVAAPGGSLILRGFVWFGLYVALLLAPLCLAAWVDPFDAARPATNELGVALGFIAFALVMVQFALVSRLDGSTRPFGADALMQFHRQMGIVGLGLIVAHTLVLRTPLSLWQPFAGTRATNSGAVAVWALVILVATSLMRRRLRLSYEAWQAIHLAASILAVVAMVVHVRAVNGYAQSPAMRSLLLGYAAGFMALTLRYRVIRPLLIWRRPWEVVSNRDEGGSTRTLRLAPVGHRGFAFEPGQFAWLITGRTPLWSQQHPISISSSAERSTDGGIEFSIKALGDWSAHDVPALAPGRRVWVDGPFGAFTPDRRPGQGLVLIAGGIGIAPMRSMLLTMRDRQDRRDVVLVHAAHDETRLLFQREMDDLRQVLNLRVTYVLEEPDNGWPGERGVITRDLLAAHLPRHYRRYQFFVCGPAPMMDSLGDILMELGVSPGSIQTERFTMV